ncbi:MULTISPECIES: GlxA family transcriptional regulator [Catenuloplanes]|uniref:Transcriptional regulator GlxA family with amidase domain n=1 Tax=Catenuloplanes niger TaxID=587534 RepID=A0AAE3ZQK2_9ACTN|nr:helix-turn-helix domain-containing protein [Catenuloplanes niger]MDR7323267.1 transcriptional regulator GlxA family with amidase domain [Catenuloplanes niger]
MRSRNVAIIALPRYFPLDVTLPQYVLGSHPGYRVTVHETDVAAAEFADVVVVPGFADPHLPVPGDHLAVVRAAHDRGARILAVCTGTFALAAAGVLDGRRATTHWRYLSALRTLHPAVTVLDGDTFVEDGTIVTSAGAAAETDVCLHLIRTDFGASAADRVAREVVPAHAPAPASRDGLSDTREWLIEHLASPITVQRMADHAHLSRRTFIRRFERETGTSPMRWLIDRRLTAARRLLETTDWSVERVARSTGFGTAANLRTVFARELDTTPTAYRRSRTA